MSSSNGAAETTQLPVAQQILSALILSVLSSGISEPHPGNLESTITLLLTCTFPRYLLQLRYLLNKAVEVFRLVMSQYGAPDTFVTVTIDEERRWKTNVVNKNVNPKWIMKDPIKLYVLLTLYHEIVTPDVESPEPSVLRTTSR
jgi:hypothetical protein